MSKNTKIEWTDVTWNPFTGCTKKSEGCFNCYAERMSNRLKHMKVVEYANGFTPATHMSSRLNFPYSLSKPKKIFVNSMSDTFHESFSDSDIIELFNVMNKCHWHTFQVLTKRPERLVAMKDKLSFAKNIWIGVTVENDKYLYRIDLLRRIKSVIRFVSFEPLIGGINLVNLTGIDWVIVGAETGPKRRCMDINWAIYLVGHALYNKIPAFVKNVTGHKNGKYDYINGRQYKEFPVVKKPLY